MTTIVTEAARYYYNTVSQGITISSDYWNMITDGPSHLDSQLRLHKNVDDWLVRAFDLQDLENKQTHLLKFCHKVELGGCLLNAQTLQSGNSVFLEPWEGRVTAFQELTKPQTKNDLQLMCGFISTLQMWYPSVPLNIPNLRKAAGGKKKFDWNEDMKKEYDAIKQVIR